MIKEAYVSDEIAKLLKEKGFDEPVTELNKLLCEKGKKPVLAITHQKACAWLREVHKISIEITSTGYLIDGDATWGCDIKAGHRLYYQHITNEKSYESCVEAALKYVLENLIWEEQQ